MRRLRSLWTQACAWILMPPVGWAVVGISLIAFFLGIVYWYGRQPPLVPPLFWVFVPDCPLYAFLFGLALAAMLLGYPLGQRLPLLSGILAFGLIKYGVWTVVAWIIFWSRTGLFTPESMVMTVAHVGMILEGIFLLGFVRINVSVALMSGIWFLANDAADYILGYHPGLPWAVPLSLMGWHTLAVTLILTGLYAVLARRGWGAEAEEISPEEATSGGIAAVRPRRSEQ